MAVSQLILFIVTNHGLLGNTSQPTGWYLPEIAHPYNILSKKFTIVMASPKGGYCPMDPSSLKLSTEGNDTESLEFVKNTEKMAMLNNSKPLDQINPADYAAVFFPGGYGPMFDLADNALAHKVTRAIYEAGGVVGAVCHGTIGIASLKLTNGSYLVKDKSVTGFSNSEEEELQRTYLLPLLLETVLLSNGAKYSKTSDFDEYAVVDGKIVTGQNPASSMKVGLEMMKLLCNGQKV